MPDICPECKEPYDYRIEATSVTSGPEVDVCHRDLEFEGDANTGVWYFHE